MTDGEAPPEGGAARDGAATAARENATNTTSDGAATAALVGATGGAGTTRCAVEMATTLARDGRSVAVLDAAFATQGLSDYVPGRLETDLTALVTDDTSAPLAAGLVDLDLDVPGRVACCPVRAPFERLARAKTAGAARRLESRIEEAADAFDHVLVDTPPVAANQSVAAATACERTALVAPATDRGADAIGRMRDRLDDLGVGVDVAVANRGELAACDVSLPASDAVAVDAAPVCEAGTGTFAAAVAAATERTMGWSADGLSEDRGLFDRIGGYVSNR
ncbi:MAG: ParA family protein [Salinigranum sp.]